MTPGHDRSVPAPELREVAQIWWDVDIDPVVVWDGEGLAYDLTAADDDAGRLALLRLTEPAASPRRVAEALAEGLASCDFPPTGEQASPGRVRATLRAAGLSSLAVDDRDA